MAQSLIVLGMVGGQFANFAVTIHAKRQDHRAMSGRNGAFMVAAMSVKR